MGIIGESREAPHEVKSVSALRPFHIAFPVDDLDAARHFYGTVLEFKAFAYLSRMFAK